MIIEIALGIVLAVVIVAFLPVIIAFGIAGLVMVTGLAILVGFIMWFPNAFVFGVPLVVNLFAVWNAYRNAKKHDEKDAQVLQQGQGKSATGLTWLEPVSDAERKKTRCKWLADRSGFAITSDSSRTTNGLAKAGGSRVPFTLANWYLFQSVQQA